MKAQDIIGLTIAEFQDMVSAIVKLGADKGCSFIFCGDISEFDSAAEDKRIIASYKDTITKSETAVHNIETCDKDYETFVKNRQSAEKVMRKKWLNENKGKPLTAEQEAYEADYYAQHGHYPDEEPEEDEN